MILVAVLHNIFAKEIRTISLNTHRIILTKSLRDSSQISFLSRQCYPHVKNFLPAVYQHCIKLQDFPYLILNFSPGKESENYIKVTTKIFPHEHPMVVFRENECKSSSASNPYEKLILINQNLYDILRRGEGKSNCENTINAEESVDFKNSSPSASVKSNNNNNIEIIGFDRTKNGNPPNRTEEPQYSTYNEKDTIIPTGESKSSTNNIGRVEDKSKSSVPFMLPSMNEVFKKQHHDVQDMDTDHFEKKDQIKQTNDLDHHDIGREIKKTPKKIRSVARQEKLKLKGGVFKNHRHDDQDIDSDHLNIKDKIKQNEDLDQYDEGRDIKKSPEKIKSVAPQEKIKLKRLRNVKKNLISQQEKDENSSPTGRKNISQNIVNSIEGTSVVKIAKKRKGQRKINRSIHPFKIRKIEVKEKPLIRKFNSPEKRKAIPVLNREIHPFKAKKNNKGDKRKNDDVRFEINKRIKEKHSRLNTTPSQYQKWNF